MAWIKLEKMYEQEKTSTKGKKYKCFTVEGTKKGYKNDPDKPWAKDLFPGRDTTIINKFKAVGIGNTADVTSEKDGDFWKVVDVRPLDGGGGGSGSEEKAPDKGESPAPAPAPGQVSVVYTQPAGGDDRYIGCLRVASDMVLKFMEQSENFKALIKRSATPELMKQLVVDFANYFYQNNPGKAGGADAGSLLPGLDGGEKPVQETPGGGDRHPGEEDIPF